MGTNTLNARSSGQTILDVFFNDFNTALDGDFVGRNSSGVPTSGQNLGTVAFPWGSIFGNTLVLNGAAVDTSKITSPVNRIVSGKTRASSNQPAFITPNGAALSFIIKGLTTSLILDINGIATAVATDLTKGSLTAAPSSQNTALVNDTGASGQEDTRLWGEPEHRKSIIIDTVGSNITALVGSFATFKIGTEYFYGYVKSTTEITKCRRGFFYDPSLNPLNRVTFSDDDTITLMKTAYIFVDQDTVTVDVTYNPPVYDFTAPGSPVTGDYWYDLANRVWKRYDGASFVIINRTFVGWAINDATNCVAARCEHFYALFDSSNNLDLELNTTEIVSSAKEDASVNVYGNLLEFGKSLPAWNITTNLAGSSDMYHSTEQASLLYHIYLADNGKKIISDISPYYRDDLKGRYHPHNPWRAVGLFYNDGSSNIVQAGGIAPGREEGLWLTNITGAGSTNTPVPIWGTSLRNKGCSAVWITDALLGDSFTITQAGLFNVTYGPSSGSGSQHSVTLNVIDATKFTSQITGAEVLIAHADAGETPIMSSTVFLHIGDVLRGCSDGTVGSTHAAIYAKFLINKVG